MSLTGKVIVVTGASSGIGAAVSEVLAKSGGLVGLVGRDRTRLDQVLSLNLSFMTCLYTFTILPGCRKNCRSGRSSACNPGGCDGQGGHTQNVGASEENPP